MYWNDIIKNVKVFLYFLLCFILLDKVIFILYCKKKNKCIYYLKRVIMFFGFVDFIVYLYIICIWDYVSIE